ncbi:DUF4382 domain-containing protein [Rhodonellum sp.]|uniref:DUF4382 domain-containing protein n=1 Tax=Rhodonellum sp. TaxID=2231180 RepID=UPI00271FF37E|nr:DUF4382 domain-containing protein [Rhodonellum sp.]MDO9551677.1 DUF4382 domain-containing protein [Rhodonellum sp.]
MKNLLKNATLGIMLLVLAASCDSENSNTPQGKTQVNIYMVDAPADYDEVWVEVLAVKLLLKGEKEENDAAWININQQSENQKINLLSLVGNNDVFLGGVEVPSGEISQIRLVLGSDNYIIQNGKKIELKTPSAQQSGLKLKISQKLQPGVDHDLVLDFDAGKSIVKAGNSGQYILKPVIRVIAEGSAGIQGIVLPLNADPIILGIVGQDTVSTFTDENGYFKLRGLKAGNYIVVINPKVPYEQLVISPVQTTLGETKTISTVNLSTK